MKIEVEIDDEVIISSLKKDYEMLLGILHDVEQAERISQWQFEDFIATIDRVKAYEVILKYYSIDASEYIVAAKKKAMVKYA